MRGNARSGQSFVELMVAIGIGAIFTIGVATIVAPALIESGNAGKVQTAVTNAQSLLNNVRVWSEASWNNVLSLATGTAQQYYLVTSSSPYTATSGVQSVVIGTTTYTDYFYLADAYRTGAGALTAASSGNTYDPSTKQVFAVYDWTRGTTGTISTYVTRNEDEVFYQNDWSGGATSTVVTSTNNQFASSSNINYASTTGAIYVIPPVSSATASNIVFVQSTSTAVTSGTSTTISFPSNTTAGDLILVAMAYNNDTNPPSVSDSQSNTFNTAIYLQQAYALYYAQNIAGGHDTINVGYGAVPASIAIFEYSGLATSSALYTSSTAVGTGNFTESGGVTTQGGALFFGLEVDDASTTNQTYTSNGGFTTREVLHKNINLTYQDLGTQDDIANSGGTEASSFTLGTWSPWWDNMAVFTAVP